MKTENQNLQQSPETYHWGDAVGFEKDKILLRDLVREERLPTVILFEGKSGIGKSSLLFYLAALHFCETQDACGHCPACQRVATNQDPDLLLVKGEGDTLKVSAISDIGEFLSYAPQAKTKAARRIVLIVDAENLTIAAVNKLLKTLEEPSPSARIFISSSRMRQLLPTLLSRCVHWHLRPPSLEQVEALVLKKFPNIKNQISIEQLREVIHRYGHSPGKVFGFLERGLHHEAGRDLLQCKKVGEVLSFADTFRQEEWKLADFLPEFEYALNKMYRDSYVSNDRSALGNMTARRSYLRELKTLVNKQKIAVNTQMAIETLAFYNLQIPVRSHGRV